MLTKKICQLALVLILGALTASAQSARRLIDVLRLTPEQMSKMAETIKPAADDGAKAILNGRPQDFARILMAFLLARQSRTGFAAQVESARTDKQISAPFGGSGSLNTVDRPGLPALLGFALQHGAITQNITGNTLTLSTSPYMLVASVERADTAEMYANYGDTYGRLA